MLRFERLNTPDWAMLYLDSGCETCFDLAPCNPQNPTRCTDLLRPIPESRQSLHTEIQTQLAKATCYRTTYPLKTRHGTLEVLETGEAFLADNGQLRLRGYLIVYHAHRAETDNPDPQACYRQHLARSRAQQRLIANLACQPQTANTSLSDIARRMIQPLPETCGVTQASLWLMSEGQLQLLADTGNQPLPPLNTQHYPLYLQALQEAQVLDIRDVDSDPRTRERTADFHDRGVTSILEAVIRNAGEVLGVLRLEHSQQARDWHPDEIAFARELADLFALAVANQQRQGANHSLNLFQRAIAQSASAFLLINKDERVEYVNPSFANITQLNPSEVQGRYLADLPELDSLSQALRHALGSLESHNSWQGEFQSQRKDLSPYWGHLSVSRVLNESQQLTHYILIYEDVTETRLARQHIERLVYSDNLTGLANRACFIHNLEERFAQGQAHELAMLLVDIDNFKRINDSLGHRIGDKLLIKLAHRLQSSLGKHGLVARFASNEFAILMNHMDFESGLAFAQQILCALDDPIYIDSQLINISGSVGLACAPLHGNDPHALMKHAGLALHKAKANGKNQVQVFTETLNAEADFKLFLENNLRAALSQNELAVFYQPKVCLRSGKLLGLEALLRWHHPERGMISPDQFIRVAEETGLIIPIGNWAARQACRMAAKLPSLGLGDLHMAINLSPRQFSDPELVAGLQNILREEQLSPHLLELELTESLLLDATEATRRKLNEFKAMGISLAMDDFGTGYSSLSYLKKFPIDVIKIDRSFIKDIPDNQDDMEITSAVIAMARNLRLKVVAEGIETPQQLSFLRRHQCDIGQGYLFDKPIPGTELLEKLQRYAFRDARDTQPMASRHDA